MGRILAIDYGTKRVGIAWSDPLKMMAHSQPFLENNSTLISVLVELVRINEIEQVVVGLPKNRHGKSTRQTERVMQFVNQLKEELFVSIELVNEAYSTQAASKQLHEMGKSVKAQRSVIDSQAAAFFLQGYLDRF